MQRRASLIAPVLMVLWLTVAGRPADGAQDLAVPSHEANLNRDGGPLIGDASPSPATPVAGASPVSLVIIEIVDFQFEPRKLEISTGTTVRWVNSDLSAHTATDNDGSFDSGRLDRRAGYRYTFVVAGTYSYECAYHKDMAGSIVVREVPAR